MENKISKFRTLNLSKELTSAEQKKILGGAWAYVTCSNGETFRMGSSCDGQAGYCPATGRGTGTCTVY